jgi:hypothetical protein
LNHDILYKYYEGGSKIVHIVGTCCAVGYTLGWACCDTCGLLVSYCCGADLTLEVHCCPLFICTKEEQRAVIRFLWAEGVLGAEMHRRISALSMRKEPDASCSFLMLNACTTILEPLDPFVDHPL